MWKLPGETPESLRFGWEIKLWRAKAGCDSPPINEYSKLYGRRSRVESSPREFSSAIVRVAAWLVVFTSATAF